MMVRASRGPVLLLVVGGFLVACLRAPIGDDDDGGSSGSSGWTGGPDSTGLSASEGIGDEEQGDDTGAGSAGACHPSYEPCLPIVGDLNCPDVVALGVAPVMVVGPDDYGLDSDNDGIGCEQ